MPRLKETYEEQLSKCLRVALAEKGWSQEHLATLCDMTPAMISKVLSKPLLHRFSTVMTVAKKLGVRELPTQ